MPAKGTLDRFHGKHLFVGPALWRAYKRKTGDNISYKNFCDIIESSMEEIQKWVLREPIGFQLDPKLGNIAVNRFKPKEDYKAYLYTSLGKIVNHNLHTGGDLFKIQWFHSHASHECKQRYWFFVANRNFKRALASTLKSGKGPTFNSYMQSHFITKTT